MKNKYQEALKELKEFIHSELDGTRMLDEYLKHCDTLQELVDKNKVYTLEEVKKMWEELGYEIYQGKNYISMKNKKKKEITIKIKDKYYFKRDDDNFPDDITFQEHQLLTKTIKALEVEDERQI